MLSLPFLSGGLLEISSYGKVGAGGVGMRAGIVSCGVADKDDEVPPFAVR